MAQRPRLWYFFDLEHFPTPSIKSGFLQPNDEYLILSSSSSSVIFLCRLQREERDRKMGGCATKPKVLKAEDNTVPEPAPAKGESCTDSDAKIAKGTEEIGAVKVEDDKVDEQGKKPRSLGLFLEEKNDLSGRSRNSDDEVEVLQARCHYSQAEVDGCIFNLNGDAYVKGSFPFFSYFLCIFILILTFWMEDSLANCLDYVSKNRSIGREIRVKICLRLIYGYFDQLDVGCFIIFSSKWYFESYLIFVISDIQEDLNVQVTVPSLASVFNEYALSRQAFIFSNQLFFELPEYFVYRDQAIKNLFLYGYGAIFNFLAILGTVVIKGPSCFDILQGHSKATMFLIFNNAAQGILSSFFFKYAVSESKRQSLLVASCVLYSEVWHAVGRDRKPLRKQYVDAIIPPFVAILRRWCSLLAGIHDLTSSDGLNPLIVNDCSDGLNPLIVNDCAFGSRCVAS
ncbi:hypothetical protein HHK36_020132 [Tetracentron sinense]|uniref:Uncharacterized protein n=1 Tax=Tetracentron sinense TaxID=13715 RepID=A0A834YUW9_TETSI|nr:hypothetical protein HHK36_020132 [Tetracentron sinense]